MLKAYLARFAWLLMFTCGLIAFEHTHIAHPVWHYVVAAGLYLMVDFKPKLPT